MSAVMTANGQSQYQKHRPHRHGTTTTRTGNQPIGFFNAVLFFMFAAWPNYLPNAAPELQPPSEHFPTASDCRGGC